MPYTDHIASQTLIDYREDRGLTQEGLATAIKRHALGEGWMKEGGLGHVDADVIRRIERTGHCPSERIRLVISLFFGVPHREMWAPKNRRYIEHGNSKPKRKVPA